MKSYLIFLLVALNAVLSGQPVVTLSIKNQHIDGDDFYFDIYIKSEDENLLMENCDFVLNFNADNFTGITLNKVGPSPGFCTFNPVNYPSSDDVREEYYDGTAASIVNGSYLVVNVFAPTPNDQATFDKNVARIDDSDNQCLGRFRLSSIDNHSGTAGLSWKMSGTPRTNIYTFENAPGFQGSEISSVIAENPFDALLPIELSEFHGFAIDNRVVKLIWSTESETNNEYFEIQRTIDLHQWANIGTLPGTGNSASLIQYSYIDKEPNSGTNYYRLHQVDFDGEESFSSIINVEIGDRPGIIYPNPVSLYLNVSYDTGTTYEIFDNIGIKIKEGLITQSSLNVGELISGIYYFKTPNETIKFTKL